MYNFIQTSSDRCACLPSQGDAAPKHVGVNGGMVMHDSRRCRALAAERLLATRVPCDRYSRKLNFSMAALWLFLARQDEAVDDLLGRWGTDKLGSLADDLSPVSHENGKHPSTAAKLETLK
jgi:hypothetical protein